MDRDVAKRKSRACKWVGAALVAAAMIAAGRTQADENVVPPRLQANLLAKVVAYDRNLHTRAGERVHILFVGRSGNADSDRFIAQMESAFASIPLIAGLPHDEDAWNYDGPDKFSEKCRTSRATIVYFGPGLYRDLESIRTALDGMDILSVAADPEYISHGVVLGFELEAGRPKLLFDLAQARRQNVSMSSDALQLMKVFR